MVDLGRETPQVGTSNCGGAGMMEWFARDREIDGVSEDSWSPVYMVFPERTIAEQVARCYVEELHADGRVIEGDTRLVDVKYGETGKVSRFKVTPELELVFKSEQVEQVGDQQSRGVAVDSQGSAGGSEGQREMGINGTALGNTSG